MGKVSLCSWTVVHFDTSFPGPILFVFNIKPASVPSWIVAVAVRRRTCGFRFCAVVRRTSGGMGRAVALICHLPRRIALCTPVFVVPSVSS
jgi:hypothetical protein